MAQRSRPMWRGWPRTALPLALLAAPAAGDEPTLETRLATPPPSARVEAIWTMPSTDAASGSATDFTWFERMGIGAVRLESAARDLGDASVAPDLRAITLEADRHGLPLAVTAVSPPDMAADGARKLAWRQNVIAQGEPAMAPPLLPGETPVALYAYPTPDPLGDGAIIAPQSVINLTSRLRTDGSLDWVPSVQSEGRGWVVLRLVAIADPATLDRFDGGTVRRTVDRQVGALQQATGGLVGARGITALTLPARKAGQNDWTPLFAEQFRRLRGYDPLSWLPVLSGAVIASRADSARFAFDYRVTLDELAAEEFDGMIAHRAKRYDLAVIGAPVWTERAASGDPLAPRRQNDATLAELASDDAASPAALADLRAAASAAHVHGQHVTTAAIRLSASPPGKDGIAGLDAAIDRAFAEGANRIALPLGSGPGQLHPDDAALALARPWLDAVARRAALLQLGQPVADIAWFIGDEASPANLDPAEAPRHYGWDMIGGHALRTSLINDGAEVVTPGQARYRAIYLGATPRAMSVPTLRRLAELVEGGATVIGPAPSANPSLAGKPGEHAALVARLWSGSGETVVGKGRVIATPGIDDVLAQLGLVARLRISGAAEGDIAFVQRRLPDGDSFFLLNRGQREAAVTLHFGVTGKAPERWHPDSDRSEPLAYQSGDRETAVPLTLAGGESAQILFRKPASSAASTITPLLPEPTAGPWTVMLESAPPGKDKLNDKPITLATLVPLNDAVDARFGAFSGVVHYARRLSVPRGWKRGQPLWLDLGGVDGIAEISFNGRKTGSVWRAPYRVDVSAMARPGQNRIDVRIAQVGGVATQGLTGPVIWLSEGR